MLSAMDRLILEKVAGLHDIPQGAYNIRKNGEVVDRKSTANIEIISMKERPGIRVVVKPETRGESIHIPVIVMEEGIEDVVHNTFEIGEFSDVLVIGGCGIHNPGSEPARQDSVHEFLVRKGARLKYVEQHYAQGEGNGKKILNPQTFIEVEEQGLVELELVQIKGVDSTRRETQIRLQENAGLVIVERLLTAENQEAESRIDADLLGADSSARIISRSVARDHSKQLAYFNISGHVRCRGHIECDAIIMDNAQVIAVPKLSAYHSDARLIHEAAIGKVESEQMLKLMSIGLAEKEAEETILTGFLR
jgi:Fe-S cluster assembly scaffold protein SufB